MLVLTPCLKQSECRPPDRENSPNCYEKCFNGDWSHRHLLFRIDITFLDAAIFHNLISPTFCE